MSLVHGCLWFFTTLKDIEMKNDKLSVSSLFEHLRILGQTSLFFYIVHYVLYFMMGLIIKQALGFTAGMEVRGLLFCWLLGLMIVYPLCKAYRAWKLKQKPDSIFLFL
jgi:cell shape-determining protein MreD